MNVMLQYLPLLFLVVGGAVAQTQGPGIAIVQLPEYTAFGFKNTTAKGTEAHLFLGMPYAEPPERFEKAEPLQPSFLRTVTADAWPDPCHQMNDLGPDYNTSEDCLYFNVFTPSNMISELRPVFVFIHGGGYFSGFTEAYGFEYFVDNFIPQDIIVVTLQYRLAHFGYLATRDHVINGNFGLFDQLEALKFIKKNIAAFGGDPNRITLGGHSAGSTSTHALSWHPDTSDLWNQEIRLAGSNYAKWGIASELTYNHSEIISKKVGCDQKNTTARKECLKEVNHTRFWEVRKELNLTDVSPDTYDLLYWTPNLDDDFFQGKTMDELQANATKRKTLYGLDIGESLHMTLITKNPITNIYAKARGGVKFENRQNVTADKIRELVLELLVDPKFKNESTKEAIIDRVFEHYEIGNGTNASDPYHYFDKYTEVFQIILKISTGIEIKKKMDMDWEDQYLYQFDYVRPQDKDLIGNLPGHGYFLLYLCGLNIYTDNGISNTTEDNQVQNNIAEVFGSFIKTSIPSVNGTEVPKAANGTIPYMLINTDVSTGTDDIQPTVDFWLKLAEDYQYDFLRLLNL